MRYVPARTQGESIVLKKLIAAAVFGLAGLMAFAGTCTITHISLVETDGTHDTFGGQLDNNSGVDILQHNFVVSFLDGDLQVVETKVVDGCLRSVQDGETDFFSLTSTKASSNTLIGLARIAFDSDFKVGTVADGDVTISDISVLRDGDELTVTGKIKNNDGDDLIDAAACIVVRDNDGNVLITGKDDVGDINTDATKTFSVTITVPDDDTADSVDVWVDGLDGSSSDDPIAPASDLDNSVVEGTPTPTTATATPTSTTPTATATAVPPTATATP
jgi:hypothetical protein